MKIKPHRNYIYTLLSITLKIVLASGHCRECRHKKCKKCPYRDISISMLLRALPRDVNAVWMETLQSQLRRFGRCRGHHGHDVGHWRLGQAVGVGSIGVDLTLSRHSLGQGEVSHIFSERRGEEGCGKTLSQQYRTKFSVWVPV